MSATRRVRLLKGLRLTVYYVVAIAIAVAMVAPFAWSLLTSFKPDNEIIALPPRWLPSHVTLAHYVKAFTTVPFGLYFWNSFYMAALGVLLNLFFGSLAGYAFAKLRFTGNRPIFGMLLAAMAIPGVVLMIPQFYVLRHIPLLGGNNLFGKGGHGLLNSFWAVVLPGASGSFAVFFMRQFFLSLPDELMEAARIDGCGEFGIFWRIYLPQTQPALATLAIFTFQAGWNSFLWPLIVLNDPKKATIQMGLQAFSYNHQTDFGPMMAGAIVAVVPILILFVFFQKYFVRGIALSGVKG